jgi:hypothetical protein
MCENRTGHQVAQFHDYYMTTLPVDDDDDDELFTKQLI